MKLKDLDKEDLIVFGELLEEAGFDVELVNAQRGKALKITVDEEEIYIDVIHGIICTTEKFQLGVPMSCIGLGALRYHICI